MPIYMKFGDKIKGDVTSANYAEQIEVSSFQLGVGRGIGSPNGVSNQRETSAASVSEVTVTKMMDKTSRELFAEAIGGETQTVVISFVRTLKDAMATYLEITLEHSLVSGYSVSSGGDRPTESLSINFTKIAYKYIDSDADGTAKPATTSYDLGTHTVS